MYLLITKCHFQDKDNRFHDIVKPISFQWFQDDEYLKAKNIQEQVNTYMPIHCQNKSNHLRCKNITCDLVYVTIEEFRYEW